MPRRNRVKQQQQQQRRESVAMLSRLGKKGTISIQLMDDVGSGTEERKKRKEKKKKWVG